MSLARLLIIGLFALLGVTTIAVTAAIHGQNTGWLAEKKSIDDWGETLEPDIQIVRPETDGGPHPVMLIFSGCGGVREHHADWAALAASEGYIGIVVDSMTPRGMTPEQALARVCSGTSLWGRERAGDVMAMMQFIRTLENADPSRVVLFGQSHGAWSIMDLLAMDFGRRAPTSLWPRPDPLILSAIKGTVLLYPYCGVFSLSLEHGWSMQTPSLMILAGNDEVVSPLACREAADRLIADGVPLVVDTYEEAGHSFDEFSLPEDHQLKYIPERAAEAKDRVRRFLRVLKKS